MARPSFRSLLPFRTLRKKKSAAVRSASSKRSSVGSQLGFEALEPRQMLANITAATSGDWHIGTTWVGGNVPGSLDRALIGTGKTVTLGSTAPHVAKEIVVNGGVLNVGEGATNSAKRTLSAEWIHVNSGGTFQIGTAGDRYDNNKFELTLTGTNRFADHTIQMASGTIQVDNNNGFLMTGGGGQLQFHGEEKLSFTKLAATANSGSNKILVENVIERNFDGNTSAASDGSLVESGGGFDWHVNDQIVVASSDYDYANEDRRTIGAIKIGTGSNGVAVGRTELTLTSNLSNRHYGVVESYAGGRSIDLRAEVALLSRSITIQGIVEQDTDTGFGNRSRYNNSSGDGDGIGGHTMIMAGSGQITIDGVRFDRMGQTGQLGRYPVHWHVAGDRTGDILRNSTINNSNNRGVTIHGTHNVLLENNTLHDIHGHGFFMEDAVETGNRFLGNIVLGVHKVGGPTNSTDPFIVDTHDTGQQAAARFIHSAAYWITNPDNTWVGNIAAGSEGTGFWFALPEEAIGVAAGDPQYNSVLPQSTNLKKFEFNTAHSAPIGLTFDRGSDIGPNSNNSYSPPIRPTIKAFTGYKHDGAAIYHRGNDALFLDNKFADSSSSTFNTLQQEVRNALYVGHSQGNSIGSENRKVTGQRFYDGPGKVVDSHFAGYAAANAYMFASQPGSYKNMHPTVSGLTFENDGSYGHVAIDWSGNEGRPREFANALLDLDGSLTGGVGGGSGYTVVPASQFLYDADRGDFQPAGWDAWVSQDLYAEFRIESRGGIGAGDIVPYAKITAPHGYSIQTNGRDLAFAHRMAVKLDTGGVYTVEFTESRSDIPQIAGTNVPVEGYQLRNSTINGPGNNNNSYGSTIFRVIGGAKGGLAPQAGGSRSGTEVFNLTDLMNATSQAHFRDYAGDMWVKMFEDAGFFKVDPRGFSLPPNPSQSAVPAVPTVTNGTKIQVENYDTGGQGFGYWDSDSSNNGNNGGNTLRTGEGVDLQETTDAGGGHNIGWTVGGEFTEYTADIVAGVYDIDFRVASIHTGDSFRLLVGNGDNAEAFTDLGLITVPNTGGHQDWDSVTLENVDLTNWGGSNRVFRLETVNGGANINWFEFKLQQSSYVQRNITEGTTIKAEEYDEGGQGLAYNDTTAGNGGIGAGTSFRTNEDVDVSGGTNLYVSHTAGGEWLEYTTDVTAGVYDIGLNVAFNSGSDKSLRVLIANSNSSTFTQLGSDIAVPATGGFSGFETQTLANVDLTPWAGEKRVIRVEIISGGFQFDTINFAAVAATSSVVNRGVAYGNATAAYGEDAIDATKSAYLHLPGTSSTTANYTNYTKGLNRVIVDLANSQTAMLDINDFDFRVGNTNDPSGWTLLDGSSAIPLPTIINGARNSGTGVQRFTLAWEGSQTIKNQWLQVTVKAGGNTGLASADVFYFGNQIADVFGSTTAGNNVAVNAIDTILIRANQNSAPNSVGMNNVYDIDRNGSVNAIDTILARANQASGGGLLMLSAPEPPSAAVSFSAFASALDTAAVEFAAGATVETASSVSVPLEKELQSAESEKVLQSSRFVRSSPRILMISSFSGLSGASEVDGKRTDRRILERELEREQLLTFAAPTLKLASGQQSQGEPDLDDRTASAFLDNESSDSKLDAVFAAAEEPFDFPI